MAAPYPVFDAHVDSLQRALDLGHDLGRRTPGHLDLVRGREGGLATVVLVSFVDPEFLTDGRGGPAGRAERLIDAAHELAARHPDRLQLVGNEAELREAHAAGRIAGLLGIEGGHAIEEDLGRLRAFFDRGLRVMTLVWNNHLSWIRSCRDEAPPGTPEGLSEFGRSVVGEMNRLGIVVDLSHAGVRSFHDALGASEKPVIASHSGCHAVHAHPRNLTDDQLRALGVSGGVVGIVFHPGFLDAEARADEVALRETEGYLTLEGRNGTELLLAQSEFMTRAARPFPAARLVDHVMHAVRVAGVEAVGIGSDFDGIERGPRELSDASCYPRLAELLAERGLDDSELRAVMGGNFERVLTDVTGPGTVAHDSRSVAHVR